MIIPAVFAISPFFYPYILQTYPHEDSKDPLLKINLDPFHPRAKKPQILRRLSPYNAKRQAKSANIENRRENLSRLQEGHPQVLNIHARNFANLQSAKSLRVPDYPEENRAAPVYTPPQVYLHTDPPQVPADQPQISEISPQDNAPAPSYSPNLRPIHVKAPVPKNRPLEYVDEPSAPALHKAAASAATPTAKPAPAHQSNLASAPNPVSVPSPVSAPEPGTTTTPTVPSSFTTLAPKKLLKSETS